MLSDVYPCGLFSRRVHGSGFLWFQDSHLWPHIAMTLGASDKLLNAIRHPRSIQSGAPRGRIRAIALSLKILDHPYVQRSSVGGARATKEVARFKAAAWVENPALLLSALRRLNLLHLCEGKWLAGCVNTALQLSLLQNCMGLCSSV